MPCTDHSASSSESRSHGLNGEGRRAARVAHRQNIMIGLGTGGGHSARATVKDISVRGFSIICRHEIRRGSTFVARFPRKDAVPLVVLCTVAHCRLLRDELYLIGAEFTCVVGGRTAQAPSRAESARISRAILNGQN